MMEIDEKRLRYAQHLTEWVILISAGFGLLGVVAWFTSHPVLFYIAAGLSTLVSVFYVGAMVFTGFTKSGSGFIPICILLFIIGILVTHQFLPGILLGGAFFGIYSMGPMAIRGFNLRHATNRLEKNEKALKETQAKVDEIVSMEENREARVMYMSQLFDELWELSDAISDKLEELEDRSSDVDALKAYMSSGRWKRDFEADERGELSPDINRSVLSEDGLYNLLDNLDEYLNLMEDSYVDLDTESEEDAE